MTKTRCRVHTFGMRNVIPQVLAVSVLAVSFGCSSESDGFSKGTGGDAGALRRGAAVSGSETDKPVTTTQPGPSLDAQAPDSVVVVPDTKLAAATVVVDAEPFLPFDTAPDTQSVRWAPGQATADPGAMTCPPTEGNSIGVGAACTANGVECPKGTVCGCGYVHFANGLTTPRGLPCVCITDDTLPDATNGTCRACGENAGCCKYTDSRINSNNPAYNVKLVCLPSGCASKCQDF